MQFLKLILGNFMHAKTQMCQPLASTQAVRNRNVNRAMIVSI
jgi:hypothetical protein